MNQAGPQPSPSGRAILLARQALHQKQPGEARRWAMRAAALDPHSEDPWLILAAIAAPHASLAYLKHALEINPRSQRARAGMHWAIQRQRALDAVQPRPTAAVQPVYLPPRAGRRKPAWLLWTAFGLLALAVMLGAWLASPFISTALAGAMESQPLAQAQVWIGLITETPTPTYTPSFTPTPTNTFTPTPTNTPTPTFTFTPTPTFTFTPTPTDTPLPTDSPLPRDAARPPDRPLPTPPADPPPPPPSIRPEGVGQNERWIDVDLSKQRVFAYEGDQRINSFLVSTGTWEHPTVTGQFRIYVKYQAADMSGPGYYLPGVPYVMYFYKGYGLHGTYWHNNFGTPMSHGCVNLRTDEANWLFNWASLGTLVNVHQ